MFTASGSEADNLAIAGTALARLGDGDHLVISDIEHPAVLAACRSYTPTSRSPSASSKPT